MKKFTIATYLRPATVSDVFDHKDAIIENKQFFYQQQDGTIYGPQRLLSVKVQAARSMWKSDIPKFIAIQKQEMKLQLQEYQELYLWLGAQKMFVVDSFRYQESIAVHLKVKEVAEFDILECNELIPHTAFFRYEEKSIKGPFYITDLHSKKSFRTLIQFKNMFVFDRPGQIKVVETNTAAEAV
jgi:hypothetical protein